MKPLRALLVDVGGVLVDEGNWPTWADEDFRGLVLSRLADSFGANQDWFSSLSRLFALETQPPEWKQRTREVLGECLANSGLALTDTAFRQFCGALAPPLKGLAALEPGVREAMVAARLLGLRLAICSNTVVRTGEDYRRDMKQLGLDGCFEAYITSLDVGFAKPHPAMFEAGLLALGVAADEAAMIGDRPDRDVAGAQAMGLRAIWRRTSRYGGPCDRPPDAEIDSLWDLPGVLRGWVN